MSVDHMSIRTSRYKGIDTVGEGEVVVESSCLHEKLHPGSSLLIVDDVFDSGLSMVAFFEKLEKNLPFALTQLVSYKLVVAGGSRLTQKRTFGLRQCSTSQRETERL